MGNKKNTKSDTQKTADTQTKTITSYEPFNKYDKRIIDYMCKISKNIYNSSIYCHQIYDIFYIDIYNDLFSYVKANNDLLKINQTSRSTIVHNLLTQIFNIYHTFYSKNLNVVKNLCTFIWKTVYKINNENPIIHTTIANVIDNVFIKTTKEVQKTNIICRKFFNLIQRKVYDAVIWIYNENLNMTKTQILSKTKCTINNQEFIDAIKTEEATTASIIDRSFYKEKIGKFLNIKMNSDQFIIKKFTVDNIGNNVNLLPSDIITNIIDKSFDSYKSFLALKNKGIKCNRQTFLPKDGRFNLFYTNSSRKLVKIRGKKYIRLNVGQHISQKYIEITKNEKMAEIKDKKISKKYIDKTNNNHIIEGNYVYIKVPKKLELKNIKLLNIVPIHNGRKYKVCYNYETKKSEMEDYDKSNLENYLFGDSGIVNLLTFYDPTGNDQYIISGKQLNSTNHYYNEKIDNAKSELKIVNNKNMSHKISTLFIKKEHKIDNYFNNVCKWIVETFPKKKCVVIGYNPNWKNKANIGAENNRKFYEISYTKLLNKLKNKLELVGMELKLTEESYTSKCDGLALENICKKENYLGKRIKRGLFSSSKKQLINADINGAINIGRKYMKKIGYDIKEINKKGIFNPKRIRNL